MLHGNRNVPSPFRPLVVSRDGLPFEAGNGVRITPDASFADCPRPDIVCVTDLLIPPGESLGEMYEDETQWMRAAWDAGATLCSSCSGALLLARTGLLDGQDATSHWAYCDLLAREYPRTRWHAERGLVVAQLVAMSGVPERTFKRRFTLATGMSPIEYIHTLRLEEAKQMLESTQLPVEAVAMEVGYQDASFFGRLFRRKVALTPAQYRRRFGALNRQLRGVAAG